VGRAAARADAPGGREADKKWLVECGRAHLDGFMLYKDFFGDIMRWLMKTSRRGRDADGRKVA
jgi:hypothetical protein